MRRSVRSLLVFGLLTAFLSAAALNPAHPGQKTEPGFTSLFNGKDFTGWKYLQAPKVSLEGMTETPDGRMMVKDGIIIVNEKDKNGKGGIKDLFTVQEFNKDFILRVEFRAAPKADSGVYLRSVPAQLQVRDYPTVGPYKKLKNFKDGDWNELEIVVKGTYSTTTVNGKTVTDKDIFELTVKDGMPMAKLNGQPVDVADVKVSVGALAECKCNGEILEKAFKIPLKGGIGLQAESGKFEFRNIRIKVLD
jgi:hypothetical protein